MPKKSPVKILHIIPSLGSGGAERLLADIVFDTSGYKIAHTICVLGKADFFRDRITAGGAKLIELDLGSKRPWLKAARRIRKIVHETGPDMIVSWLYDASIAMRLASIPGQGIPLVTTLHAPDYDPDTIRAGKWPPAKMEILRWIDKITAKISKTKFVACSNFVAESHIRRLGVKRSNIRVIHNFVDPVSLGPDSGDAIEVRDSLGIPKDAFLYSNVGRLDPQKGQIYLLRAFSSVVEQVADAYLLIVGHGPLYEPFKELARELGIEQRVVFAGRRKDVGACLEASDVFVFPPLFEGFGIALIEAMAKSVPSIASRLEVLEEIVEHRISGIFVAPESEAELASAMIEIYQNPALREKIGHGGFERAKSRFFSVILIPEWEKLFLEASDHH